MVIHRRRRLAVMLSLALAAALAAVLALTTGDVADVATPSRPRIATRLRTGARARPPALPPLPERAAPWLAAHPPSPELRDALIAIARHADALATAGAPHGDGVRDAEALARREGRVAEQQQLRTQLRAALEAMSPAARAALRAAHINVIQLAHFVATQPTPDRS